MFLEVKCSGWCQGREAVAAVSSACVPDVCVPPGFRQVAAAHFAMHRHTRLRVHGILTSRAVDLLFG